MNAHGERVYIWRSKHYKAYSVYSECEWMKLMLRQHLVIYTLQVFYALFFFFFLFWSIYMYLHLPLHALVTLQYCPVQTIFAWLKPDTRHKVRRSNIFPHIYLYLRFFKSSSPTNEPSSSVFLTEYWPSQYFVSVLLCVKIWQ